MNSIFGYGLVLAGLSCAAFATVVGLSAGLLRREGALPWVQRAIYAFACTMFLTNIVMVKALLEHDFSVKYVAQVGSLATPTVFTVVSLWSALEGSILFWGAIMGAYLFAFTWLYRHKHERYMLLALGVMGAIALFFTFLIAGPANPWTTIPNPPSDGPGPNPLLQNHILMIIHPPMLYCGYVGMTVPFGIAAGALLRGELTEAWLVPLRKWTLLPWMFLSIGIILGSWWAYAVLGWGGYWAWDPVENASLMPWLTATAFLHSLMVLERKRALKLWTLSLALGTFVLTIIGTFMTRSGVFNSVHSFTQSDIGPTFLIFIAILLVFSVTLLAARGHLLVAESQMDAITSREGSILLNNLILAAMTFVVLLGTLYPLAIEAFFSKKITVGEPYFNQMTLPLGLGTLFLMGVGPALPWGALDSKVLKRQLLLPTGGGIVAIILSAVAGYQKAMPLITFGLAAFAILVTLRELFLPAQRRMKERREHVLLAFVRSVTRSRRRSGGYIIHLGIIVIIVAIAASSAYKVHSTATLQPGEIMTVGAYQVRFDGLAFRREVHREYVAANITVITPSRAEIKHHDLQAPRMNYYERSNEPIGSPSVNGMLLRDVYVSLLAFNPKLHTASFNAWVFPLVGWIWYAIPFLVVGALLALWPSRRFQDTSV